MAPVQISRPRIPGVRQRRTSVGASPGSDRSRLSRTATATSTWTTPCATQLSGSLALCAGAPGRTAAVGGHRSRRRRKRAASAARTVTSTERAPGGSARPPGAGRSSSGRKGLRIRVRRRPDRGAERRPSRIVRCRPRTDAARCVPGSTGGRPRQVDVIVTVRDNVGNELTGAPARFRITSVTSQRLARCEGPEGRQGAREVRQGRQLPRPTRALGPAAGDRRADRRDNDAASCGRRARRRSNGNGGMMGRFGSDAAQRNRIVPRLDVRRGRTTSRTPARTSSISAAVVEGSGSSENARYAICRSPRRPAAGHVPEATVGARLRDALPPGFRAPARRFVASTSSRAPAIGAPRTSVSRPRIARVPLKGTVA